MGLRIASSMDVVICDVADGVLLYANDTNWLMSLIISTKPAKPFRRKLLSHHAISCVDSYEENCILLGY